MDIFSDVNDGSIIIDILLELNPEMNRYINLKCLVPYLNRYKILTKSDRFYLNNPLTSPDEKMTYLLSTLDEKSTESLHNFLRALKEEPEHTGHQELCKLIAQKGYPINSII